MVMVKMMMILLLLLMLLLLLLHLHHHHHHHYLCTNNSVTLLEALQTSGLQSSALAIEEADSSETLVIIKPHGVPTEQLSHACAMGDIGKGKKTRSKR
jgi:aromatic ring-opening dioxygenase LigB subunit